MNGFGSPGWIDRVLAENEIQPHQGLVVAEGVTHLVTQEGLVDETTAAARIAGEWKDLFVCVVVADEHILGSLQGGYLFADTAEQIVHKVAVKLAQCRERATVAFPPGNGQLAPHCTPATRPDASSWL